MKYLDDFKRKFSKTIMGLTDNDILNIIDKEIDKSEKFGLKILPKDLKLEKEIILKTFKNNSNLLKKSSEYNNREFEKVLSHLKMSVKNELDKQLRYYFENTPPGEVKNRYQCHIEGTVNAIFFKMTYI